MMKLRKFKKEDALIIASWLRSEEELYKWSADRFNKYPLKYHTSEIKMLNPIDFIRRLEGDLNG